MGFNSTKQVISHLKESVGDLSVPPLVVDRFKIHCFSPLQRAVLTLLATSFLHLLLVLILKVIKGKSRASPCAGAVPFSHLGFFSGG